ncbi:MAG: hypothetical protein H5T45_00930 [Thermoplasmatales archaeon]|nr:hypothetical protein [Thermoplasmatales archaeon]
MVKRTRRIARLLAWLRDTIFGYTFLHNYLKPHWKLSEISSKNWIKNSVTLAGSCVVAEVQYSPTKF